MSHLIDDGFTPAAAVVFTPPFHPDYGLDNSTRVEVVRLVVDWGVPVKDAAASFNLSTTTVRNWIKRATPPSDMTKEIS